MGSKNMQKMPQVKKNAIIFSSFVIMHMYSNQRKTDYTQLQQKLGVDLAFK